MHRLAGSSPAGVGGLHAGVSSGKAEGAGKCMTGAELREDEAPRRLHPLMGPQADDTQAGSCRMQSSLGYASPSSLWPVSFHATDCKGLDWVAPPAGVLRQGDYWRTHASACIGPCMKVEERDIPKP